MFPWRNFSVSMFPFLKQTSPREYQYFLKRTHFNSGAYYSNKFNIHSVHCGCERHRDEVIFRTFNFWVSYYEKITAPSIHTFNFKFERNSYEKSWDVLNTAHSFVYIRTEICMSSFWICFFVKKYIFTQKTRGNWNKLTIFWCQIIFKSACSVSKMTTKIKNI